MPRKGCSKKASGNCLVCNGATRVAHLGIDLCRACYIFYRRCVKVQPASCRSNSNQCTPGPALNCKKCRFGLISEAVNQKPTVDVENLVVQCEPSLSENAISAAVTDDGVHIRSPFEQRYFIMERLKTTYRAMCHTRIVGEMQAHAGIQQHPLQMCIGAVPTVPTTYKFAESGNQIMLASLLEFGNVTFPEFEGLAEREKWEIVTELFYRFKFFEGYFRANLLFPDHPNRFLPTFTSYLCPEVYSTFYDSLPAALDVNGALKYINNTNFLTTHVRPGREAIARLNPTHEEFLAIVGLMFWSIESLTVRPEISALSEKYISQIMKELHTYYRETLNMVDYATRLGEVLMLLQTFDVKDKFNEHLEMLRLLNVIDDNSFIYRFQKDLK